MVGQKRGTTRSYGGVLLSQLLPSNTAAASIDAYEIHHGFFHTTRLDASSLDPDTELLIADELDRHSIDRTSLFYLVGKAKDGKPIVIGKVTAITVILHRADGRGATGMG